MTDAVPGPIAEISAIEADWSRETKRAFQWHPPRSLIASIRSYQYWVGVKGPVAWLCRKVAVLRHRFWSMVTGADIPINSSIGGGLMIPHPNGIVINPGAVIGPNCLILQQVTIGSGHGGVATIGGHVDFGAGAKILGAVTIGDHAVIGANAVVTKDVPAGAVAVGIPAKIVKK